MDYEQEFAALWKAVDDEKEAMYVETTDEMMEYILRFSDMERFLKEAYEEGQRRSFWKFHIREPEKDFRNVNIYVTHHFRYDQHETHCHDYFQMCYCVRGGCSIRLSDGVLPLVTGDLLLLAPGTLHSLMVFSDDCSVIKIYVRKSTFDKTFFAILTENNILGDFLRCSLYGACPGRWILFPTGDDPELTEHALRLYMEVINYEPYFRTAGEAILTGMFCRLMRRYLGEARLSGDISNRGGGVVNMLRRIRECHADLTLDAAAADAGYSRSQYCHILKRSTGKTFTGLLNDAKIEAAAGLLRTTDLTVIEIGERAGFSSNEHFHRLFREIKGCTPKEWRNQSV